MKIKNITKENFSDYGELISTKNNNSKSGNANTAEFYFDLARIEILGDDSNARLNIIKVGTILTLYFFPHKVPSGATLS